MSEKLDEQSSSSNFGFDSTSGIDHVKTNLNKSLADILHQLSKGNDAQHLKSRCISVKNVHVHDMREISIQFLISNTYVKTEKDKRIEIVSANTDEDPRKAIKNAVGNVLKRIAKGEFTKEINNTKDNVSFNLKLAQENKAKNKK